MENVMDDAALAHLAAWADRTLFDDERETVVAAILALVADDPGLMDRGWPAVRELSR